jgi:hypothetical protein
VRKPASSRSVNLNLLVRIAAGEEAVRARYSRDLRPGVGVSPWKALLKRPIAKEPVGHVLLVLWDVVGWIFASAGEGEESRIEAVRETVRNKIGSITKRLIPMVSPAGLEPATRPL